MCSSGRRVTAAGEHRKSRWSWSGAWLAPGCKAIGNQSSKELGFLPKGSRRWPISVRWRRGWLSWTPKERSSGSNAVSGVLLELSGLLAAGAWPWMEQARLVITLSRSGAVAAVVEGAWSRGWQGTAVVLEGSPGSGSSGQAKRLAAAGTTLLEPDASAARWIDRDSALVIAGADAVSDRRFVNCAGTQRLFELARARGVNRMVIADTGKNVSDQTLTEIVAALSRRRDEKGGERPLFEAISAKLISTRISESGPSLC